jgi:hypothetical protein
MAEVPLSAVELVAAWPSLGPGRPRPVAVQAVVVGVAAYLADSATFALWRESRGAGWRKGMVLPCFDLRLEGELGPVTVQLEPGLGAVEAGRLLEGDTILLTLLSRAAALPSSHLVLHGWTRCGPALDPTPDASPLADYSLSRPLGHPGAPLLCPWSLMAPLWPPRRLPRLATLPRDLDRARVWRLAGLDTAGPSNQPPPTLLVRVLAASRTRLVAQQANRDKPWLVMKNLLVADRSAHTVVTLWDEAVRETAGSFGEGDILLLDGRYRYQG